MKGIFRFMLVVSALAASASAATISGTVFHDPAGSGENKQLVPRGGITINLYRDGGDGQPSDDDVRVATTRASLSGRYSFDGLAPAAYWVAADSRTFGGPAGTWAEQTLGGPGSLCAKPDGSTAVHPGGGPCYGGRRADRSDDASKLSTSEHVIGVRLAAANVNDADFAFSMNVITNAGDDRAAQQGTLRQFITNANAMPGPNHALFIALGKPSAITDEQPWWTIRTTAALPPITDAGTLLDGAVYSPVGPAMRLDADRSAVGAVHGLPATLAKTQEPPPRRPALEIIMAGDNGLVFQAAGTIRDLALSGATNALLRMSANLDVHNLVVGAHPDTTPAETAFNDAIVAERGTLTVRGAYIAGAARFGIAVSSNAKLDAERMEVSHCGSRETAAIALQSDGSSIGSSFIHANLGAAIAIGSSTGGANATNNRIERSSISDNGGGVVFLPDAHDNSLSGNELTWNRLGAVTGVTWRNRVSRNRFDENGGLPIKSSDETTGACEGDVKKLAAPQITESFVANNGAQRTLTIRGTACPATTVELYHSFVTGPLAGRLDRNRPDVPSVREALKNDQAETRNLPTDIRIVSIGEFNFLGTTTSAADGRFEVTFPFPDSTSLDDVMALQSSSRGVPGVAALAVNTTGTTSEFSTRQAIKGMR